MEIIDEQGKYVPMRSPCPSQKRLKDWLDDRLALENWEVTHLRSCALCAKLLEGFSDSPALSELAACKPDKETNDGFEREPELKAIQARVLSQDLEKRN